MKTTVAKGSQPGSVFKAVFNYGIGSYVPQIVSFLLIPLFTHYIAPAEMGVLEIYLTAQTLLVIVMRLGLQGSIARFYFDYREGEELRDLVTTVAVTVVLSSLVVTTLGLLFAPMVFARFLPEVPFHPYMDIVLVTAFFLSAPDLQKRLLQAREQSKYSAKLSIFFGVASTLLSILFVMGFNLGALGVLLSNLVVGVLFAGVALVNHRDDLRGRFRGDKLKAALKYGLPLVPHHSAAWLNSFAGRWTLGSVATVAMVGHLGLAAKIASPLAIITGAFANAYSPVYFSWRTDLNEASALIEARRIAQTVFVLGCIAVIGAATFGDFVVRHFMQQSYAPAAPLVGIIAAALFANLIYTLLTVEIFYAKQTIKWISVIFIASAAVNLALVALFAQRYGATAAALAQLAGSATSVLLVSFFARRTFPLPLDARTFIVSALGAAAACLVPFVVPPLGLAADLAKSAMILLFLGAAVLLLSGAWSPLLESLYAFRRNFVARRASTKTVREEAPIA